MHLQGLVYLLLHVCFHSSAHLSSLSNEKKHEQMDVSSNITGQQQVPVLLQGTMKQPTSHTNTLEEDIQDNMYEYITDNIPAATTTKNILREIQEETKFLQLLQGDAADEDDLVEFITVSNLKESKAKKTDDKSSTLEQTTKPNGHEIKKSNDQHVNIPARKQDRLLPLGQTIRPPHGKLTIMDLTAKTYGSSKLSSSRIRHRRDPSGGSGESGDGSGDFENDTTIRISTEMTSLSSQVLSSTAPSTVTSIPLTTLTKNTPTSPKPSEDPTTTASKQDIPQRINIESTFLQTLEKRVPMSLKFNASFNDLKTTFEEKKADLENQIFTTFNSTGMEGLLGVEITKFSKGSIIIDYTLIFALKVFLNNSGNSNDALTTIKDVLSGNRTLQVKVDNKIYGSDEQYALNELQKIGEFDEVFSEDSDAAHIGTGGLVYAPPSLSRAVGMGKLGGRTFAASARLGKQ
ncbi:uncharacterized protein LOC106165897 [Lingula anatina]|uniref:Uncharacterized protein LOC106165897 n=1 Tax=Lingula anatina TaxID=7574 RepID=A0A1S3IND2_LINAN|nr:uncharacterized protein LOC106165897 [Lingula anatina]|eukprot:XP_013399712.1 uncharacterized protein LOC106165897 [Lingula anatina]